MVRLFIFLYFIIINTALGEELLFENFTNKPEEKWEFITDQVMGGISDGKVEFISEDNKNFARMTGSIRLENNGGFIQIRKKLDFRIKKESKAIKLTVRGNNQEYYIHIRTSGTILPWQYYQAPFTVSSKWEILDLNFSDFKRSGVMLSKTINPKNIKSIAIVAYGREHNSFIDVDKIIIY